MMRKRLNEKGIYGMEEKGERVNENGGESRERVNEKVKKHRRETAMLGCEK